MEDTDAQILENRKKVVEYLQKPGLRKAIGRLRVSRGRCCLGHMCEALGINSIQPFRGGPHYYGQEQTSMVAPEELIDALGMDDSSGFFRDGATYKGQRSLAGLNDNVRISPQGIGKWLATKINGGDGAPWKEITVK